MLYRSAQIDSIPFCSRRELKNMGIRTIIDLRSEEERHNYPQFHDEDFNVLHLPIATGNMEHILQDIRDKKIETDTIYRLVERMNRQLVTNYRKEYKELSHSCSTATIIPSSSTVLQAKDVRALFQHWYLPLWESMKKPS